MASDNSQDREIRLDALLNKQEIYECLTRMSRGSDRCDRALFMSAFHDDAMIAAGPFVGSSAELFDWSSAFQTQTYTSTFHQLLNHHCEIDGDTAHSETYYLFVGCMGTDSNLFSGGRYIDRFERREGQWRLAVRNNVIEYTSIVPGIALALADVPGITDNGAASQDKNDLSYLRPLTNKRPPFVPPLG